MSPNQELCKEELSLLQRESLGLFFDEETQPTKNRVESVGEASGSLLEKDEQSLKLEKRVKSKISKRDMAGKLWNEIISSNFNKSTKEHCSENYPILMRTLSSIRVLNSSITKENSQWLDSYQGQLESLPLDFILTLKQYAPQFNARVADFNDNLFYNMQDQYGLNHLLNQSHNNRDNIEDDPALQQCNNLDSVITNTFQCRQFLGSFMATENTIPQPAHVDFTWERLARYEQDLRIGFFPLTTDGMFLQVWKRDDNLNRRSIDGEIIFIPFGKVLSLPATTIHGGGFRSTLPVPVTTTRQNQHGNLRFHLYMANNDTKLSKNQTTNKYTEPNDKRKELADRYVDSPVMNDLIECLFV